MSALNRNHPRPDTLRTFPVDEYFDNDRPWPGVFECEDCTDTGVCKTCDTPITYWPSEAT